MGGLDVELLDHVLIEHEEPDEAPPELGDPDLLLDEGDPLEEAPDLLVGVDRGRDGRHGRRPGTQEDGRHLTGLVELATAEPNLGRVDPEQAHKAK